MKYVFVSAADAERVKRELIERDLLATRAPVLKEDDRIGFAVIEDPGDHAVVERDVEITSEPQSLREALRERYGERADAIKRAFDVVGDIAIIETTEGFGDIETGIAEALLEVHSNVKAVYVKDGAHTGEYRVQAYRWLAGEKRTTTIHRENGYELELDISTTYFSPRVGSERLRIARLVENGERVLVLGSGIAPYGICIVTHADPERVVCVEFNPEAHRYAERNIERNHCKRVEAVNEDAYEYLQAAVLEGVFFDRIVMPLPAQSAALLPAAWKVLREGGVAHVYRFLDEEHLDSPNVEDISDFTIEHVEKVGAAAPGRWRVCLDLRRSAARN